MITKHHTETALTGRRMVERARRFGFVAALVLATVGTWVGAPSSAAAESECQRRCSGPHQNYQDCMERCISRERDDRGRHETRRSIHDLCSARGHDEESCLREHGWSDDDWRRR